MTIEARVREVYRRSGSGLTPDEVAFHLNESILAVRPVCTRLLNSRWLTRTGELGENVSGKSAHVLKMRKI